MFYVKESDHIKILCVAYAIPNGTVKWFKNGIYVCDNVLELYNAVPINAGYYTCEAENEINPCRYSQPQTRITNATIYLNVMRKF